MHTAARRWAVAALLVLAGCPGPGDDDECADKWQTMHDDTDGVLLSVQGTGLDDIWVSGGGLEQGFATLRHFDGAAWRELAIDDDRTLWWVTPDRLGGAWAVGERGAIVHADADGTITHHDVDTTATFYGVFASHRAGSEVWVVGEEDTVLRWQGDAFEPVPPPTTPGTTLYKVWAYGPTSVWVVGEGGTILHWDGAAWIDHSPDLGTNVRLLTVVGCDGGYVFAVGGQHLYMSTGGTWSEVHAFDRTLNGVACRPDGAAVVGNGGLRADWNLDDDAITDDTLDGTWDTDYHSVWFDYSAGTWAAGGSFNAPAPAERRGVLSATVPCSEGPPGF